MQKLITGIQQIGIGVTNADEAKLLYKDLFGMDVLVFDDIASAQLMSQYTGNEIHQRRAILSINMQGGGGFEIWQFTSRKATDYITRPLIGDIGIFATKIKVIDIAKAHAFYSNNPLVNISPLCKTPDYHTHFWVTDRYGNIFDIVEGKSWFKQNKNYSGGVCGAVIGVSNMEQSIAFYGKVLGIDEIIYDITENLQDAPDKEFDNQTVRRVLLNKSSSRYGAFSKLLGCVQIELIEAKERTPNRIFNNRFWGDCGFIHVCFDVLDMDALKHHVLQQQQHFTVDSANSFAMGSSAGRFCYMEDPDGTLIELVETHKVPIFKKLGFYFNLKKRKSNKPLADWMVNLLALNKVK